MAFRPNCVVRAVAEETKVFAARARAAPWRWSTARPELCSPQRADWKPFYN